MHPSGKGGERWYSKAEPALVSDESSTTSEEGEPEGVSRREFLVGSGALVIGVYLGGRAGGALAGETAAEATAGGQPFAPNAFVRVSYDDSVTVIVKHIEFGQGPFTGLATLVAEEMDAAWSQMRAEAAPADEEKYLNLVLGIQGTGGSSAMASSFLQMRRAGAVARQMLVEAAAELWQVPSAEVGVSEGLLRHEASGRTGRFGEFARAAARRKLPKEPKLKSPEEFRLIGKDLPRLDTAIKSDGRAEFTLDVQRDGMLVAVVEHPPKFGARVESFDGKAAKALPGVVDLRQIEQGVAIYGEDTHAALKGRRALRVQWDESQAEKRSSEELFRSFEARAEKPGALAVAAGDAAKAIEAEDVRRLDAVYRLPYLAHAPMEPLDAVIEPDGAGVVASLGSQMPAGDQRAIAEVLGLPPDRVAVRTLLAGGSFGRRAQPRSEFAREAAAVYRALGGRRPVKLMWTREDDIQGGYYRPLGVQRLRGAISRDGDIVAWDQTIATQALFPAAVKDGVDPSVVEGVSDMPYAIPHRRVTVHLMDAGVPVLWWRSVGHSSNGFTVETFLDELLELAGHDAVRGRIALLEGAPHHRVVLERVAEMASWGRTLAEGRALGVAVHESFGTCVAQIAEVSAPSSSSLAPRVHRVWCAVDCGTVVNPNIVRAQMEGGIGYGLGAALFGEITLSDGGTVRERNFDGYRPLRSSEMPEVEVSIIESSESPTGVGEPGTPPIAPAVANAWRRLTGKAVRQLPFASSARALPARNRAKREGSPRGHASPELG